METKSMSLKRVIIVSILAIFLSAIFAILVHAILPASVDHCNLTVLWFNGLVFL